MSKRKGPQYDRKSVHTIEETFAILDNGISKRVMFHGESIKRTSNRYRVFRDSVTCPVCGCEGTFFALEKSWGSQRNIYHLNLYAMVNGNERLMTKDHIVPKSIVLDSHSADSIFNLETMCERCNGKKGNKSPVCIVSSREISYTYSI